MQFKFSDCGQTAITVALAMTIAVPLSACSVSSVHNSKTIGAINSQSQAQQVIRHGMTMQQVEAKLGRPANRATFNSQTTWVYGTIKAPLTGKNILSASLTARVIPDRKTVVVTFNKAGRVSRVDYSEQINS